LESAAASSTIKTIQPVVVRTDNVAKELVKVASSYKVPPNSLDFTLLSSQTFSKKTKDDSEEWEELSTDEVRELDGNALMLSPDYQIKQTYEVEIFTATEPPKFPELDLSIGANSELTKVYVTIKPGSKLHYYPDFAKDMIMLINKKKLRAHLMIHLFDRSMSESVNTLRAKLQVNETLEFAEKEVYQVAQGIEPVATVNDKLILHYEAKRKQQQQNETDRIDYSKRGYLLSAIAEELLIEYIKPRKGEPGRNCRGEYIEPVEPVVKYEPTFAVSDKISVNEDEKTIKYRAKQNGYVTFENATYDIRSEVDITEISFKTTGSIETDLNADVSINVKEKDVMKDAIGMGMEVEVNEIHIEGNVGPKAKIRSMNAVVEGQTHQSSFIESEKLNINIHKGKAKGKEIHITRLEHGEVEGDVVSIKQAIGGTIRAKEVTIEILGSHVKIFAAHRIVINKLQGGENTLVIDPLIAQECKGTVEEGEKRLKEAQQRRKEISAEIERYTLLIRKNESAYLDIKKRLVQYKKSGVTMPSAFVKKYKEFHSYYERLETLKMELHQQEEKCELLQAKFSAAQNDIFEARIVNNDRWRNHNEIIFKLVDPVMEISYVPLHNTIEKELGLKEIDEEYKIVATDHP